MGGRASAQTIAQGWRVGASVKAAVAVASSETSREEDVAFMRRALELAEQHRGRTSPNPIVGCVIVDATGKVIAEGAHRAAGQPHAEADALAKLKGKAKAATLYVNLEPCMHAGRTPPCAPAVIASGVTRVVIGSEDPIPGHGGGIAALRAAGITVDRALVAESDAANRPFFTWARELRPAFTLKAAMTLDGKIATVAGESKWITGEAAREDGRKLRNTHDAILVGIGTILADDPELTTRLPGGRDPVRIIVDSTLRIPTTAKVLKRGGPQPIIVTTEHASEAKEKALVKAGADVLRVRDPSAAKSKKGQATRVALAVLAKALYQTRMTSVLVEGGGEIHASFLAADLVDELVLYVAPKVVGGSAKSWVGGEGVAKLDLAHQFQFVDAVRIGEDLRIRAVRRR